MEKLRFEFTLLPGSDGKSSSYCITSITTSDNRVYAIPEELQPINNHKEIMKIAAYNKVKNSLTKRYQIRRVWITMTEELRKCYIDEEDIGMILTDQYPGINSKEFKEFLRVRQMPIVFTAVNAPFSNGLNERLNQTLVNKIRCKINENGRRRAWTTIAHECVNKYNNTIHSVTGFTPSYLLYGTDSIILPKELRQEKSSSDWIRDGKIAIENTIKSHRYNKILFDKNRKDYEFNVGDMVYVENGNKLNRKKLDELKIGPYRIVEKISNSIYRIGIGHKKTESNLFHVTKLIPVPALEEDEIEEGLVT